MPCIQLHQNWEIYAPIKHRCLAYCYTKLGRSTPDLLADLPPTIEYRFLAYHYTKLGRSTPPQPQSSIDALHTVTPNMADLPQICWQIYPQSSIDALHTVTPNLADLPHTDLPVHLNGNFTLLLLQLI